MRKSDDERAYYVPENFASGMSVLGYLIEGKNIIEAAIWDGISLFVVWEILPQFMKLTRINCWQITLCCVFMFTVINLHGIAGDTISTFIVSYVKNIRGRKSCFYNPRVKTEMKPMYNGQEDKSVIQVSKDKLQHMYTEYRKQQDTKLKSEIEQAQQDNSLFFKDDIGVIDTPYDYMTSSQRRKYDRQQRKAKKKGGKR